MKREDRMRPSERLTKSDESSDSLFVFPLILPDRLKFERSQLCVLELELKISILLNPIDPGMMFSLIAPIRELQLNTVCARGQGKMEQEGGNERMKRATQAEGAWRKEL